MPDVRHPLFARAMTLMSRNEPERVREHRRELLDGLSGRVLEVGAGTGANFEHYPSTVTEVVAVEPEPYLREQATAAAARAPVAVTVRDGVADSLPVEDGEMDAAVLSLVLCSVPDPPAALAELRRVLRPGGELRFYEHVRASTPGVLRLQRAVDSTFWPRVCGGCHTARDTAAAIEAEGFAIERIRSFRIGSKLMPLPGPYVIGRAIS
jgi:ubiquinone/menaquinone biosynthesis C-methylase UbiE